MGKSTISMAIFNRYVCLPEGIMTFIYSGAQAPQPGCSSGVAASGHPQIQRGHLTSPITMMF